MIKSRLFLKLFATLIFVVGLFSASIYVLSVPLIERKAYQIELEASRTILDNVFELARKIQEGLDDQSETTIESYKSELKNIVSMASGYVTHIYGRAAKGEITRAEADRLVREGLRTFQYGNDGYVWLTGYDSVLLSHPNPTFEGRDASALRDEGGQLILPTIIETARAKGEGFHIYPWPRLNDERPARKISYFRDLPQLKMVVGTGAYLADIDAEIERRKARAIEDLRQALRSVHIARTGYVYIFDKSNRMIIHPNSNIEGTAFGKLLNPASGRPISEDLKAVADKGGLLTYMWDKPDDPGNYAYQKISWVRHFPGLDWYIASSVYVDELRSSADALRNRIIIIAATLMAVGSVLGYVAVRRLVQPLNRLAETAAKVWAGDLNAESGIRRDDEIGILAQAFDGMIRRVRENIASLDSRVAERTKALEDAVALQREAQETLAEVEARQRLILDAIPASIAYLDREEHVRFANRNWARLVRGDKEAVIGAPFATLVSPTVYDELRPYMARTLAGEDCSFEQTLPTRTGGRKVFKNVLLPHRGSADQILGLFVLSLDVTDEKETERQLMEAQRLKAVGQLSGGLAHDFNNLLSIIIGNLAAASERHTEVVGLQSYLEPALRAARRGADITSRLLAFSRQHPLKPEPVEVCSLVRDMTVLLHRSLPASIKVEVPEAKACCCWTVADQAQLENVLVNLALNARDAMPQGGRLTFSIGLRTVDAPLTFDERVTEGEYVEIRVADTGCGFAPETVARAFEPFFTTKSLGSGLGLSMVYGFVKQWQGFIQIDSAPGQGSEITILLPRTEALEAPAIPSRSTESVTGQPGHGQLALVAEDNADVRQVMRQQLVDLGFSVIEAESGSEAAELVEQIDDLRLVVSDIVMPGLSGIELARRVRKLRPQIRVILVSGFSIDPADDLDEVTIIRKPWDKGDLIAAIGLQAELAGQN